MKRLDGAEPTSIFKRFGLHPSRRGTLHGSFMEELVSRRFLAETPEMSLSEPVSNNYSAECEIRSDPMSKSIAGF